MRIINLRLFGLSVGVLMFGILATAGCRPQEPGECGYASERASERASEWRAGSPFGWVIVRNSEGMPIQVDTLAVTLDDQSFEVTPGDDASTWDIKGLIAGETYNVLVSACGKTIDVEVDYSGGCLGPILHVDVGELNCPLSNPQD